MSDTTRDRDDKDCEFDTISKPNPNYKARTKQVNGVVVHSMGEYIDGKHASDFLKTIGLSAHYLITPEGDLIECVSPDDVAYHAGVSEWQGQTYLNSTYVGIELLVEGKHNYGSFLEAIKKPQTFKDVQYETLACVCRDLMSKYPNIDKSRIVSHSDVSGLNVRPDDPKQDVGSGFDFDRFLNLI